MIPGRASFFALLMCSCTASTSSSPNQSTVEQADTRVDRERDFTSDRNGVDVGFVLPTGREEWRVSVTCGEAAYGCALASATLELRFDQLLPPPGIRFVLRHELRGYETSRPRIVSGADGHCLEDMFEETKRSCTLVAHDGWSCDSLARRDGHPNPDENGDDTRPRIFVVRVENDGPPIAVHVRMTAISAGF